MKKKIILIVILGTILSLLIYLSTRENNITITALGDGLSLGMTPFDIEGISYNDYLKDYLKEKKILKKYYNHSEFGLTVKELIYEIKENEIIKNQNIELKRAINDADILIISIGMDELSEDNLTKNRMNNYIEDINYLIKLIKTLNNKEIILLGLYTIKDKEELNIMKLNAKLRDLCSNNNIKNIELNNILKNKDYYLDNNSYYINYKGHKLINEEIIKAF